MVPLFYSFNLKVLIILLIAALLGVTLYTGFINYSTVYYLVCFAILAPIGVLLRNTDTLPLVFAFIIHNKLIDGLFRVNLTFILGDTMTVGTRTPEASSALSKYTVLTDPTGYILAPCVLSPDPVDWGADAIRIEASEKA